MIQQVREALVLDGNRHVRAMDEIGGTQPPRMVCCAKNISLDGTSVARDTLTRRCMYSGSIPAAFRMDSCALTAPASGDDRGKSALPLLLTSDGADCAVHHLSVAKIG